MLIDPIILSRPVFMSLDHHVWPWYLILLLDPSILWLDIYMQAGKTRESRSSQLNLLRSHSKRPFLGNQNWTVWTHARKKTTTTNKQLQHQGHWRLVNTSPWRTIDTQMNNEGSAVRPAQCWKTIESINAEKTSDEQLTYGTRIGVRPKSNSDRCIELDSMGWLTIK